MKVDWDKIIKENHKPSRVSRRLAKMVGGRTWSPLDMPLVKGFLMLTGIDTLLPPREEPPPETNLYNEWQEERRLLIEMGEDLGESQWTSPAEQRRIAREFTRQRIFEQNRAKAENWVRTSEIPKELKQQEEEYRLGRENETRAFLLRNEQKRKAQAARLLAKQQTITAQMTAKVQAAQQGATNAQGYLEKIQAVAAASAATRAQNLQSLQALATQKGAVAAAEAEQQKAILANSAQVLAEQNAEVARLRAEAMAKQAQIAQGTAPATTARRTKAPQVKFGGGFFYI